MFLRLTEKTIIAKIQQLFPGGEALIDDCGIVPDPGPGKLLLATTDLMESGQHFCLEWHPPKMLGRKLLMVNLSDLDSSGAKPTGFMLTLAVGADIEAGILEQILTGLAEAAHECNIPIVGGDTVGRRSGLGLGITAFGVASRQLLRNGVQDGDNIYVDYLPGASHRGLCKLLAGKRWDSEFPDADLLAHLAPSPDIGLGASLAEIPQVHACIDLSDGLSKDLRMLSEASGVSIILNQDLSDDSLYGGEDYSRCFATCLNLSEIQELTGRKFYHVAKAVLRVDHPLLRYTGNGLRPLEDRSFSHLPGTN
jgi:thiamine-monophosphate kinase